MIHILEHFLFLLFVCFSWIWDEDKLFNNLFQDVSAKPSTVVQGLLNFIDTLLRSNFMYILLIWFKWSNALTKNDLYICTYIWFHKIATDGHVIFIIINNMTWSIILGYTKLDVPCDTEKVHIFWEGQTILRNLHRRFDRYYIGQINGGDFAKNCGLLRIYKLWGWSEENSKGNLLYK